MTAQIADKPLASLLDLTGKRAVVTGAAAGIGYGIAQRLGEAGANLLLTDIHRQAIEQAARQLSDQGYKVQATTTDVGRETDVIALFARAGEVLGGVDILVNNAGIYPNTPLLEMTTDQWRDVQRINLEGAFLCSREAGRLMVAQGEGGVIINIASMGALKTCFAGLAHYESSKGGMVNLTRSTALELAPHKIRAVAVAPGGIWTEGNFAMKAKNEALFEAICGRIPLGDFGFPDDIARTVLFLASDAASYITGTTVLVDGGAMLV